MSQSAKVSASCWPSRKMKSWRGRHRMASNGRLIDQAGLFFFPSAYHDPARFVR